MFYDILETVRDGMCSYTLSQKKQNTLLVSLIMAVILRYLTEISSFGAKCVKVFEVTL